MASARALTRNATREWSSSKLMIFTRPVAITQSVQSACHNSLGAAASKRRYDDFGRLRGAGDAFFEPPRAAAQAAATAAANSMDLNRDCRH